MTIAATPPEPQAVLKIETREHAVVQPVDVMVTGDEIRDRVLGLEQLDAEQRASFVPQPQQPGQPPVVIGAMFHRKWNVLSREKRVFYTAQWRAAAKGKERLRADHRPILAVADRFSRQDQVDRRVRFLSRAKKAEARRTAEGS